LYVISVLMVAAVVILCASTVMLIDRLSSLSCVSKSMNGVANGVLYQDIQVDNQRQEQ
jgi:hypothetical protein